MSSVRNVSKRSHRMAEVSAARFILGGLVGPKPRPKGVGDGQTVDIPLPLADDSVPGVCGVGYVERSVGDTASNCADFLVFGQNVEAGESPSRVIRPTLTSKKSTSGEAASARTANRHWWPGINVPRWTSDPSLRN